MKHLCTVLSLILVLAVLALPAAARATPAPAGWTWDELSAPAVPDGWTLGRGLNKSR